ncbi:MAG: hypothetical protein K6G03_04185 [Lachnospiraceae bacterium]|nr:hypothetical protein [Lachnospiraceae bacterium]
MKKKLLMMMMGLTVLITACGQSTSADKTDGAAKTAEATVTAEVVKDAAEEATVAAEGAEGATALAEAAAEGVADATAEGEGDETAAEGAEDTSGKAAEGTGESGAQASGIDFSKVDLSKYATFTKLVDDLKPEMAFANAKIDDIDVLLVASGSYDNLDGNQAAIDADIFMYDKDGKVVYLGRVESAGTATPLAIKDGKLFTGGPHFITRYTIKDGKVVAEETAYEEFDESGNATYYYGSKAGTEAEKVDDDSNMLKMLEEYDKAEVVNFLPAK